MTAPTLEQLARDVEDIKHALLGGRRPRKRHNQDGRDQLTIRLDNDIWAALNAYAANKNISRAAAVRAMIVAEVLPNLSKLTENRQQSSLGNQPIPPKFADPKTNMAERGKVSHDLAERKRLINASAAVTNTALKTTKPLTHASQTHVVAGVLAEAAPRRRLAG